MTLDDTPPAALRVVPQQRRAAATVQRILSAAVEILRQTPDPERHPVAMEQIARQAGASVPAIYRYFSGVEEVYAALVQQEQARILQQGLTILSERRVATDIEFAGTLVDFFIQVYLDLLQTRVVVLFLLRHHHEVSYASFLQAAPQVRSAMQRAGLLRDRELDDVQVVTALSSLASAMKGVVLSDDAKLREPEFRDRIVRMVVSILATPVERLGKGEPIAWSYDRREQSGEV